MARAGKKRRQNVKRYPMGRIVHDNPMTTAIEARIRQFDLSPERAKRPESATAIGRLYDNRDSEGNRMISRAQLDALNEWMEARHKLSLALSTPMQRSASDYAGRGGYDARDGDDAEYVRFCRAAQAKYDRLHFAIQCSGPSGHQAVKAWCYEDREDMKLIGDLRLAANEIARALRGKD